MCEPKQNVLADMAAGVGGAVASTVAWTGRATVRLACHRATDSRVEYCRRVLAWRWAWELAVAAVVVAVLGRLWGTVAFAGAAVVSWWLAHALGAELAHRSEARGPEVEAEPEVEPVPEPAPEPEPAGPRLRAVS